MIRSIKLVLLGMIVVIGIIGCVSSPDVPVPEGNSHSNNTQPSLTESGKENDSKASEDTALPPEPVEPKTTEAVWIAVGDVMMHMPQYPGALNAETGKYVFDPFFEAVTPIIQSGDWAIANLETPIAGADLKYTGYPLFNAPPELAEALRNAGFNMVTTANNHALDRGEKGVERTLEALQEQGLIVKGTSLTEESAREPVIVEKNEIKMGFLSYTYGTNGVPLPSGKPFLVSLMDDEEQMVRDIENTRAAGADFITVALHFGTEYQYSPNEEQKRIARKLIAAGADIIAGSHPHVVQPYEVVESYDEQGRLKHGIIIYSMGNFISNQKGDYKDYGVIFRIHVIKHHEENRIEFTDIEPIPTWVHKYLKSGKNRYRIVPLEQTIAERTEPGLSNNDYDQLKKHYDTLVDRLASMLD
ncbi:CapA family protein [Paenibacillus tarimensis]